MESCCLCSPELRSHGGFIFRCLRRGKVNVLAEKKTMKRRWLLLEKQARVVVVVICKCRCCNVDWAIISLSYLRNKWDLEFGKRSVAYRNNSKKRGLMLDIRPSFCGKLQMCHCCPPPILACFSLQIPKVKMRTLYCITFKYFVAGTQYVQNSDSNPIRWPFFKGVLWSATSILMRLLFE